MSSQLLIITNPNKSNTEFEHIKTLTGWQYYSEDGLKQLEKDKIQKKLGEYILENATSYVAMWMLIMSYAQDGYSKQIDQNADFFALEIKSLSPFRTFTKKLEIDRKIYASEVGSLRIFPFEDFKIGNEIKKYTVQNKYTLIDFWATWCKPCIIQLDSLKTIYNTYYSNGFTILSISVDSKEKTNKAREILVSKSIMWPNIFDYDGEDFNKFTNVLPFNFLLDQNGSIIDKNLTINQLNDFLHEKLKK